MTSDLLLIFTRVFVVVVVVVGWESYSLQLWSTHVAMIVHLLSSNELTKQHVKSKQSVCSRGHNVKQRRQHTRASARQTSKLSTWAFLLQCGEQDPSLFCTDRPRDGQPGTRNNEYISLFADQASVLQGRTALECYADFMYAFREAFLDDIGLAIHEVAIGGGPCGELRYPSYVETQGWRFPGVGGSCTCPTLHAKLAAYQHHYMSSR